MTFDASAEFCMTGHNIIITGGAQNICSGIARTLAGVGANVMVADLNGHKAANTAAYGDQTIIVHERGTVVRLFGE